MATPSLSEAPSHDDLEQAAYWYACLRDGKAGASDRAAWRAWLDAADAHATAWRYVEDISRAFEPVRTLPNPRGAARQLVAANDRVRTRRRVLTSLGLTVGSGLMGWLSWQHSWLPAEVMALGADHRTVTGEQRQLKLSDGTQLWLNTASAADILFNPSERRISLVAGEIFVETAQDPRPFLVQTPQGQLRALGTRFNVRLSELATQSATQLAVYEGAVEISLAGRGEAVIVSSGQRTSFTSGKLDLIRPADAAREAWTQGTVVADNLPLRELVKELGRYRKGHLGVSDSVANLVVYGNFPSQDSNRALNMLVSALPIRIEQRFPWWTTLEAL
ncbi:FecR domain-containing protein [Ottowia thiooxydans]